MNYEQALQVHEKQILEMRVALNEKVKRWSYFKILQFKYMTGLCPGALISDAKGRKAIVSRVRCKWGMKRPEVFYRIIRSDGSIGVFDNEILFSMEVWRVTGYEKDLTKLNNCG